MSGLPRIRRWESRPVAGNITPAPGANDRVLHADPPARPNRPPEPEVVPHATAQRSNAPTRLSWREPATSLTAADPRYGAVTVNTPSGSPRTSSADPPHRSAHPNNPTAGPGSSSPPSHSSASTAASSRTYGVAPLGTTRHPHQLTPARVRRGFRRLGVSIGTPASPPKLPRAGPGRPKGTRNPPRTATQPSRRQPDIRTQDLVAS